MNKQIGSVQTGKVGASKSRTALSQTIKFCSARIHYKFANRNRDTISMILSNDTTKNIVMKPPYQITKKNLLQVSSISEKLGEKRSLFFCCNTRQAVQNR